MAEIMSLLIVDSYDADDRQSDRQTNKQTDDVVV